MLENGTVLAGRYQLVRPLGEGGMGSVYEAVQLDLHRRVAIKVLQARYAHDEGMLTRFRREALASAQLQHPNIAQTTAFVAEGNGAPPFLVMELVEGEPLKRVLDRERLAPQRAARIGVQILDALELAHSRGVVHRDLKPSNLMLVSLMGSSDFVKLLDFGIAKVLDEDRFTRLTQTGSMLGTPGFMAPEQARGFAIDPRTDLYSLGIVLYRAIAGRFPFNASDDTSLLLAILNDPALPLAVVAPLVDSRFGAAIDRSVRRAPNERFQSAREMREALMPFMHEVASTAPRSMPPHDALAISSAPTADALPIPNIAPTHSQPPQRSMAMAAVDPASLARMQQTPSVPPRSLPPASMHPGVPVSSPSMPPAVPAIASGQVALDPRTQQARSGLPGWFFAATAAVVAIGLALGGGVAYVAFAKNEPQGPVVPPSAALGPTQPMLPLPLPPAAPTATQPTSPAPTPTPVAPVAVDPPQPEAVVAAPSTPGPTNAITPARESASGEGHANRGDPLNTSDRNGRTGRHSEAPAADNPVDGLTVAADGTIVARTTNPAFPAETGTPAAEPQREEQPPDLREQSIEVTGDLMRMHAEMVMRRAESRVARCVYDWAPNYDDVTITITVQPDGASRAHADIGNSAGLDSCLVPIFFAAGFGVPQQTSAVIARYSVVR